LTFLTLCVFEPLFGGLGTTYDVHIEIIERCSGLQAKRDRKSAISIQRGQFDPKFQVEGVALHQLFLHFRPMNALATLPLAVFKQRNIVADFLQQKCDFIQK